MMSIFYIVSNALVIASCSAWLLEHLLSSLNLSCTASSVPTKIAIPAHSPCPVLLPSVYAWIVWSLLISASIILASSAGCCQHFISTSLSIMCVRFPLPFFILYELTASSILIMMGIVPATMHRASEDVVRNALAILRFCIP